MTSIMVHQEMYYSQNFHFNIPLDWIVRHTPSIYVDRYRWLKAMNKLSNGCVASYINNQILFFDGNYSHFDERTLCFMYKKNIQPFVLKRGVNISQSNHGKQRFNCLQSYVVERTYLSPSLFLQRFVNSFS